MGTCYVVTHFVPSVLLASFLAWFLAFFLAFGLSFCRADFLSFCGPAAQMTAAVGACVVCLCVSEVCFSLQLGVASHASAGASA